MIPRVADAAGAVQVLYAGLILSFLGGARWGFAVARPGPSPLVVTLAMLPTLVGLALLLVANRPFQLIALAVALGLHWLWDVRSTNLPDWYGRLRTPLTIAAVVGLAAGALV